MIEILYPIALTWAEARKYATYNFETGVCTWNKLPRFLFESDAECDEWNFANFGKPAGKMTDSGYFSITIPNHGTVSLHRFIWFVVTSECPEIIDHINHDKADNRWENLRNVTAKENSRNQSKHSNNTSGANGVCKDGKRWIARISVNGKNKYVGRYRTFEEAIEARRLANIKYGFYEKHGE